LAFAALAGALTVHHGMPGDMHGMAAGAMCLAVVAGTTALAVAVHRGRPAGAVRSFVSVAVRDGIWVPPARGRAVRAGPVFLRVQVLRR
jgi:hypothetical protein